MKTRDKRFTANAAYVALTWGLLAVGHLQAVRAESLTVTSPKGSYYLFEPIVVTVTLELDEPLTQASHEPADVQRQSRVLNRRLSLNLVDKGEVVCRGTLAGAEFAPDESRATRLHGSFIGCLGLKKRAVPDYEFTFWDRPGAYELTVRDDDRGLESNALGVQIMRPTGDTASAAELFRGQGLGALLLIIDREHGEKAIPAFEKLVREYGDTPYAQYARLCLALRQAWKLWGDSGHRRGGEETAMLGQELEEASAPFAPGHPLRCEALLYLARLRCNGETPESAKEAVDRLLRESGGGYFAIEAKRLLERLRLVEDARDGR